MKEIIRIALESAAKQLKKQIPSTKLISASQGVDGMTLLEITETYPDIPKSAELSTDEHDSVILQWNVSVPLTDEDVLKFKKKRFPSIAWQYVYQGMIAAGYRRIGFCSSLLEQFDGVDPYAMYMLGDIDFFVRYYSFRFEIVTAEKTK